MHYKNIAIFILKNRYFFDEIQEAENSLIALKYFNENANEQHVIVAGSLLGISAFAKIEV